MLLVQQFHDFLIRTGQTREDFALLMGVNASLLSRLIPSDGGPPIREPRLSTMKRLVAASGGAIRFEDFCRAARSWCARREKKGRASLANAESDRGRLHEPSGGSIGSVDDHDGA